MKKIFCLLIIAFSSIGFSFGQCALKISLADRSRITVAVDGRYFNKRGESITVGDLPPGRHYVKIFTIAQRRNGEEYQKMIFDGRVRTFNGRKTLFTYDAYSGNTSVADEEIGQPDLNRPVDNNGSYDQGGNTANQYNNNNNNNTATPVPDNNTVAPDNNVPSGPAASPVTKDEALNGWPVKASTLDKVKKKVAAKNTDTEKLSLTKEQLKKDRFTSAQVCSIMEWFSFESTKLEFAEWAFSHTSDKQNYTNVKEKLTYKSYREDLDKFLSGNK